MKGKTQPTKKPPLDDPHHVREVFADEFVMFVINGGQVHLSFAAKRIFPPTHQDQPPIVKREVTCRLILTSEAINAMMRDLSKLGQVMALASKQPSIGEQAH